MAEKKKILFISDHPLVPSGVGTQAKYLIEGLLKTGNYTFRCLGGAIQHPDMRPQKVAPDRFGDDWIIYPVTGYGDKNLIRQMLAVEKPDLLFMFTDPRFFVWLWEMEDEIRSVCPIAYWHVWDNDPTPQFNMKFYESTDWINALSLKTFGLLQDLNYKRSGYIPHAVDPETFKPLPEVEVQHYRRTNFGVHADKKFILFWNNRNARRKQTGDVVAAFAKFANKVGKENVSLMMHTSVHDPEGQDIIALGKCFDVEKELMLSEQRLPPEELNRFYNACDCTINIASNEGFGLATLESMMSGTPIIVHMTGGLQFQVGDWWKHLSGDYRNQDHMTATAKNCWGNKSTNWFGVPVFPASRSCTGSQAIPYIYDDRVCHDDVIKGLTSLYQMGRTGRKELGLKAAAWARKEFDLQSMVSNWDQSLQSTMKAYADRPRALRVVTL